MDKQLKVTYGDPTMFKIDLIQTLEEIAGAIAKISEDLNKLNDSLQKIQSVMYLTHTQKK